MFLHETPHRLLLDFFRLLVTDQHRTLANIFAKDINNDDVNPEQFVEAVKLFSTISPEFNDEFRTQFQKMMFYEPKSEIHKKLETMIYFFRLPSFKNYKDFGI